MIFLFFDLAEHIRFNFLDISVALVGNPGGTPCPVRGKIIGTIKTNPLRGEVRPSIPKLPFAYRGVHGR